MEAHSGDIGLRSALGDRERRAGGAGRLPDVGDHGGGPAQGVMVNVLRTGTAHVVQSLQPLGPL